MVVMIELLIFAAVFLLVTGGYKAWIVREDPDAEPLRDAMFGGLTSPARQVGATVGPMMESVMPGMMKIMRNRLIVASLQDRVTAYDVVGLQGLLGLGTAGLLLISVFSITLKLDIAIMVGVMGGMMAWIWPSIWLARKAGDRQTAISRALPYTLDLLTVTMQAGQDFGAAVRFLVQEGPQGPLSQEMGMMLQESELGKSRVEALKSMAGRIQLDEIRTLVTAVVQSTEMGSSIVDTLRIQAEEVRRGRFHKAERKAARAPSMMMIPVALFIMPAVFIVILTPIALKLMNAFQSTR